MCKLFFWKKNRGKLIWNEVPMILQLALVVKLYSIYSRYVFFHGFKAVAIYVGYAPVPVLKRYACILHS